MEWIWAEAERLGCVEEAQLERVSNWVFSGAPGQAPAAHRLVLQSSLFAALVVAPSSTQPLPFQARCTAQLAFARCAPSP